MADKNKRDLLQLYAILQLLVAYINYTCGMYLIVLHAAFERFANDRVITRGPFPYQAQMDHLNRLVKCSDVNCHEQLRMNRSTFMKLCCLLRTMGLGDSRYVILEEKVAMFLYTLGHYHKNRKVKFDFMRSGQTVSKHFHAVLKGVLRLQGLLLNTPEPIPTGCNDDRWKWFQNCLGALDGTYVKVKPPTIHKPRYRTRKGAIATNVLGVCTPNLQFIYVLLGWEGSASDSRILRDAVTRPNGLKVPTGTYYLVDAGYTNGEGFLAPYRGQRYHLNTWREGGMPTTPEEYFNMKHSSARNCIERCFGILKLRFAILRDSPYFPVRTHCRVIIACCLLHNFIRREMVVDPVEQEYDELEEDEEETIDYIDTVESSDHWTDWRTTLANQMYNDWQARRGQN